MEKAGDILKKIFTEKIDPVISEDVKRTGSVFDIWESIVGDPLSAHSKIAEIDGDAVIIHVDHPGWIQKIMFMEKQIIYRLRGRFPELKIKRLRVKTRF